LRGRDFSAGSRVVVSRLILGLSCAAPGRLSRAAAHGESSGGWIKEVHTA
jgi:hypothetical protein